MSVDAGLAIAPDEVYDSSEQEALMLIFDMMLRQVTEDGGKKRAAGTKVPWWRDPEHLPAIFSHLNRYMHGERRDPDSKAHPFVHLAWRALAIAYQDTHGMIDPEALIEYMEAEVPPEPEMCGFGV